MKTLHFRNDDAMPIIGLGTWKSTPEEVYHAVKEAIKLGYRHIDCAPVYENEKEVGHAIHDAISENLVQREELWITSKLWNNNHKQKDVIPALKKTLADLRLDYLDLYLVHWPIALKHDVWMPQKAEDFVTLEEQPVEDTWKGMEKAVEQGLVHHIGVCNFSVKKLKSLMTTAQIKPELNQVELHPYFQQDTLVDFCKTNDIHVMAYSPLGSSDRPANLKKEGEPILLEDPIITEIATSKDSSVAQVILAWIMQLGISVIPKSINPGHIKHNLDAAWMHLTDEEMTRIKALNKNRRYVDGKFWEVPDAPYTAASIWDE